MYTQTAQRTNERYYACLQRNDRRQQRLNRFTYKVLRFIAKNRHVTAPGTETQSTAQVDGHSAKEALSDTVISTVHVFRASSADGAAPQLQGGMSSQSTRCYLYIISTALLEAPREIRGAARLNRPMCHLRSMARRATTLCDPCCVKNALRLSRNGSQTHVSQSEVFQQALESEAAFRSGFGY
jgi:hypothetical protein